MSYESEEAQIERITAAAEKGVDAAKAAIKVSIAQELISLVDAAGRQGFGDISHRASKAALNILLTEAGIKEKDVKSTSENS